MNKLAVGALLLTLAACTYEGPVPELDGQDVHLTFLHTADWHSRLVAYDMTVGQVDASLGLAQENSPFGGAPRMSWLLERERARSGRVLHLDSGDCFQGAPIFNFFKGEAEMRALSESGLDAMVVGNHEFDLGGENFARQADRWATFPVLAANYLFEPADDLSEGPAPLGQVVHPYTILDAEGLSVGVIGMGNLSSLNSIFEQPNRLGIVPLESVSVAQFYIDFLRPQVDLIVFLTHSGVSADERLVRNTSGIDVVLGGHLHVVLNPPAVVEDCAKIDESGRHYIEYDSGIDPSDPPIRRHCRPRKVVVSHSGAFMKFLGRLDVVLSNDPARVQPERPADADRFPELVYDPEVDGFELLSHHFRVFPVDSTVPEDPRMAEILEPYTQELTRLVDLDLLVGYAPARVPRFGARRGDSALGNLIADSMWLRLGIQTDFALTNTTGIRADLNPGPLTNEQLFNVFPFDNTVSKMFLSGREAQEMFDFVARRSASRGCQSQAQIAGARIILDCAGTSCDESYGGEPCAPRVAIGTTDQTCTTDEECGEGLCDTRAGRCLAPLAPDASYELATSNYLAGGGSGFRVLQRNTTQRDTGLPMRDVLTDYLRNGDPCGADPVTHELPTCSTDSDCGERFTCACPDRARFDDATRMCTDAGMCAGRSGRCVLSACRNDVAEFHVERECEGATDDLSRARCECDAVADAGEECKFLACIDDSIGAASDGRIQMRAF